MTVVITMAGAGSRFTKVGYDCPKYQIEANGVSLFEWSLKSLEKFKSQKFIFACLADVDIQWLETEIRHCGISDFEVAVREAISAGQAETAYDAIKDLSPLQKSEPLWIFNIDTYVHDGMSPDHLGAADGYIYVYHSDSASMSYLKHDENNRVTHVAEKNRISNLATVGMYGFKTLSIYEKLYTKSYFENEVACVAGEQYILPIYSVALKYDMLVLSKTLQNKNVTVLGTPEELLRFDSKATSRRA